MPTKLFPFLLAILLPTQSFSDISNIRIPSQEEVIRDKELLYETGKQEVLSLPFRVLSQFIWDRYVRGPSEPFQYYGANPTRLTHEQAKLPATILVHSSKNNQGEWLPLLHDFNLTQKTTFPIFTFNHSQENHKKALPALIDKIEEIRELYRKAGSTEIVQINLVGHSLGAICSARYTYSPEIWIEGTKVTKVISIAGRLKNLEDPEQSPFYGYAYRSIVRADEIWKNIEKHRGLAKLYTIAAENDKLLPPECTLVGDSPEQMAIIPNKTHSLIAAAHKTRSLVIEWLFQDLE